MMDKLDGGNLGDAPNINYQKFFAKFLEIETLPIKEWNVNCILAYFCKLYKKQYNSDYKFKFNSPAPSKCFEVFQVKKLGQMLSKDPIILKEYIDWVFDTHVLKAKRKLTSISFLNSEPLLKEFKMNYLLANENINRSTALKPAYIQVLSEFGDMQSYGDLSFLYQSFKSSSLDKELNNKFELALKKLIELGFKEEDMQRVK
jgi:hypothetical protein